MEADVTSTLKLSTLLLAYQFAVSSKVALDRPVQRLNAPKPIYVTFSGMVIFVKPMQLQNALSPIEDTPLPIV